MQEAHRHVIGMRPNCLRTPANTKPGFVQLKLLLRGATLFKLEHFRPKISYEWLFYEQ